MSDDEISQQLADADWGTIGKALHTYALFRSQRQRYPLVAVRYSEDEIHRDENELTLGQTTQDIVDEVILKTFSRERRWDPDKIELFPWLKQQVDSVMDHLYARNRTKAYRKSKGNRRQAGLETKNRDGLTGIEAETSHELKIIRREVGLEVKNQDGFEAETLKVSEQEYNVGLANQARSPEKVLLEQEEEEVEEKQKQLEQKYYKEQLERLLEVTRGDPELEEMLLSMLKGNVKPREINDDLGWNDIKKVYNAKKRLLRKAMSVIPTTIKLP